jgi:CRP-like cAMP-binding protein/HEAT repeat protein
LTKGDHTLLKHIAILHELPAAIVRLLDLENQQEADLLLGQIVAVLQGDDDQLENNAAIALTGILSALVSHEQWQILDRLLPAVQQALHILAKDDTHISQCITALTRHAAHHIRHDRYSAARIILIMISGPATLASATGYFRKCADEAVQELALRPVMDKLLEEYLNGTEKQQEAGRLLVAFGRQAAAFLMDSLSQGENKANRIKLLKLIEDIGEPTEAALRRLLQQTTPWYVTRNVISLLGETGNLDCFEEVAPFIDHEDIRVKQEVLTAAAKIGGSTRKTFLLKALHTVPPQLTGHVISLLGDIPDDSLVVPLADLLENSSIYQNEYGEELQVATCRALGKIGSVKALPILNKIININTTPGSTAENIVPDSPLQVAMEAIELIETGSKQIQQTRVKKVMGVSMAADHVSAREASIIRLALAGDKKEAVRKLYQLIGECAAAGDLHNAERLRERFYEIAPMALNAIIRSGELIEQAKGNFLGRGFLDIWLDLRKALSTPEFSAIYHELETRSLQPDELLISQGNKNDELFFINHGTIKVFYKQSQHEVFVKSLTSGEIAGENFFNASVWTVSLRALTPSRISILKRSSFSRWHNEFPGLRDKLESFYNRSDDVHDLLNKKGLSRRKFERYQLSRKVKIQMIDSRKREIGSEFGGDLFNISTGGLALRVRVAQEKNGRLLLDKKMRITIPVGGEQSNLPVNGQVLAVHPFNRDRNEYLVHFIFTEQLAQKSLQQVLG